MPTYYYYYYKLLPKVDTILYHQILYLAALENVTRFLMTTSNMIFIQQGVKLCFHVL